MSKKIEGVNLASGGIVVRSLRALIRASRHQVNDDKNIMIWVAFLIEGCSNRLYKIKM